MFIIFSCFEPDLGIFLRISENQYEQPCYYLKNSASDEGLSAHSYIAEMRKNVAITNNTGLDVLRNSPCGTISKIWST